MGKVILVGAGPGDPSLLTLKGQKYIEQADCIVYDRLIGRQILHYAKPDCEMIYVGKENHHHILKQELINELLAEKAKEYNLVIRLKGGDPYVFGRGGEEALYLNKLGIPVDVVPGISSSIAALSYAGIPVTHRGLSGGFHVITAHSRKDRPSDIDYTKLTNPKETLVFLMGLSHVGHIAEGLMKAGRDPKTPVAVVSNGTLGSQKKCVGTLECIEQAVSEAGVTSPAIVVVGEVVLLENELGYFERSPLFGKRLFLPYIAGGKFSFAEGWKEASDSALGDMLEERGAIVEVYKTGTIEPLACDLTHLSTLKKTDHLVFTSKNGVYAFMWNLARLGLDIRSIGRAKIAVVGRKTGEALKEFGILADLTGKESTASALARSLADIVKPSDKVLWFSAKEGTKDITEILSGKCEFLQIPCYHNKPDCAVVGEEEKEQFLSCDGVIFTSGSNAARIVETMGRDFTGTIYSIGPGCSKVIKGLGIAEFIQAETPSYEGLIDKL